jgi:hypothetical protein
MAAVSASTIDTPYTIQFTGTGFTSLTGFTAKAQYIGIQASSVVITNETNAVATFSNGVPLAGVAAKAYLYFEDSSFVQHWAIVTPTIVNAPTATSIA